MLERLGTLGERIELPGIHTRGDDEVACALRSGTDQNRSFNLHKVEIVQIFAYGKAELVAQFEVGAHVGTAQVEITILHAQIVATVGVFFDGERRNLAGIENSERVDQ